MQRGIIEIKISGYDYHSDSDYLDSKVKEIETQGVDEKYSLHIHDFQYDEEGTKKIFETVFLKQKPSLIKMDLYNMKLLPNSFKLFTEKRWEKLNEIKFGKYSLIQKKLTSTINVPNFSLNVKCQIWKN